MLASETSANTLEPGLGVLISLGSRSGFLTSDELHAVAPVLGKLLLCVILSSKSVFVSIQYLSMKQRDITEHSSPCPERNVSTINDLV